jgi:glutamate racemase
MHNLQSDNRPVGIFDSGVGGLTVLRELTRRLPAEGYIYVGDTKHAPYGGKTTDELLACGRRLVEFFLKRDVKAIVMACGTSSATTYDALKQEYPSVPLFDTIRPAVQETARLLEKQPDTKIIFAATQATVKSGVFSAQLRRAVQNVDISEVACPLFAPLVEAGYALPDHPLPAFAAASYLGHLRGCVAGGNAALVLGCTHYPLLTDAIAGALGQVQFINPAVAVADALARKIAPATGDGGTEFFTSGDTQAFDKLAHIILDTKISSSCT